MLKVLKSVLGFHLEWSKCQANKHHVSSTFFSRACKLACNSIKYPYKKTISRTEHVPGDSFCMDGPDSIGHEVLPEGRARENSLAPITDRFQT